MDELTPEQRAEINNRAVVESYAANPLSDDVFALFDQLDQAEAKLAAVRRYAELLAHPGARGTSSNGVIGEAILTLIRNDWNREDAKQPKGRGDGEEHR